METAASTAISLLLAPVTKAIGDVFKVGSNVRALTRASVDLQFTRAQINGRIQEAASSSADDAKPTGMVQKWLQETVAIENEVSAIEADYSRRRTCIGGCLLNCWSGFQISRRASKKVIEVREHEKKACFDEVTENRVPAIQRMPTPITTEAKADDPYVTEVCKYLEDDEVGMVGIWGMGGVGKTFLLQKIHNHPDVASLGFDYVIWIVVSQQPNIAKLQDSLAQRLRLTLPENGEEPFRAGAICRFLESQKFLLLLDDLWSHLDLDRLGVPHWRWGQTAANPKQKVVITTRFQRVCADMQVSKRIQVKCLDQTTAWSLFENSVGEAVKMFKSDKKLKSLAARIADKCGGLPLAVKVIGRSMSAMTTWREWQDAIDKLDSLQPTGMSGEPVDYLFPLLKFSVDYLPDITQRCFICCALWPEGLPIPKDELILCWMGHGLLNNTPNFTGAYNRGHTILQDLMQACLLEWVDVSQFYQVNFKMHDIIRGMAQWIATEYSPNQHKWMVRAGIGLQQGEVERWRSSEKVSLMRSPIFFSPSAAQQENDDGDNEIDPRSAYPYFPILTTLILKTGTFLRIPNANLFSSMPALVFLDLATTSILNFSLEGLDNLKYLDLSGMKIDSLPTSIRELTGLEYLRLANTKSLKIIPRRSISSLRELKFLDLVYCQYMHLERSVDELLNDLEFLDELEFQDELEPRSPVTFSASVVTLSALQTLSCSSSVSLWKLSILELSKVASLNLSEQLFRMPETRRSLQELIIRRCSSLCELEVTCEHLIGEEHCLDNLEVLVLSHIPLERVTWRGVLPEVLFGNLRYLSINCCQHLKNLSWIEQLRHLEELRVKSCRSMVQVIGNCVQKQGSNAFSNLKILSLEDLNCLEAFCSLELAFSSLEDFQLIRCPNLKRLPFYSPITKNKFRWITIIGTQDWWDGLAWEEDDIKLFMESYFQVDYPNSSS